MRFVERRIVGHILPSATITVNGDTYQTMVKNYFVQALYGMMGRDLTPLDSFLLGSRKAKCYIDMPVTIEYLKANILDAIAKIVYKK